MYQEMQQFKRYIENRYPDRSTSKHYMSDLAIFSQFISPKPLDEIGGKEIDEFVQTQREQGLKGATINRRISTLSSFYEFLIGAGDKADLKNPVIWKRHSIRMGHHLPRDVDDEVVASLLNSIDDERDRAMFELMIGAGLRVGEVAALKLSDLHPVDQMGLTRIRVRGKGDKDRITWLTPESLTYLERWLTIRPETEQPYVFLNHHQRQLSVDGIQYRLKQYCQQTGIKFTCHQLRHTYARRLVEQGMPIDSLAKLLGHRDLQTTQRYIDGADPTVRHDFRRAMAKLDQQSSHQERTIAVETNLFAPAQPDERPDPKIVLDNLAHLAADLPEWLQQHLTSHTLRRSIRWQPHRLKSQMHGHFSTLCRIAAWLVNERDWQQLDQLHRRDLVAYVNARQEAGIKPGSIAAQLTIFRAFWRDMLNQELVTNGAIVQVKAPPTADHLPRYLKPDEFQRLEQTVQAQTQADTATDRFNQAWFYLLAHAGLRKTEVLNLRLSDLDLKGKRLRILSGKGDRDRVIPLTDQLVTILQAYLLVREPAATDHLLIYKGAAVKDHLIPDRLQRFGSLAQIAPLTPHRLRHTLATFLLNQGMPITSLQKFLGHQDINKTLIYARVYDETVRRQFATAMSHIQAIAVADWPISISDPIQSISTTQI
jgi:integrase/recombinase XerD